MARLYLSKTSLIYWSVQRQGPSSLFILLSLSTNRKKSFYKQKLKGHTTVLRFIRFQESGHDVIGTQSCQSKLNTQWVSLKRFIDEHGHNNDTWGYKQCVEKKNSFLCVLKCLNKWNGRKKISLQCLQVKSTLSTFVLSCKTDDRLITGMEWLLYFINNANLMTQQLLEIFMQPNIVIHQPNFWIARKNGGHLQFSNVYLWRHSAMYSLSSIAIVYTAGRFGSNKAAMVG